MVKKNKQRTTKGKRKGSGSNNSEETQKSVNESFVEDLIQDFDHLQINPNSKENNIHSQSSTSQKKKRGPSNKLNDRKNTLTNLLQPFLKKSKFIAKLKLDMNLKKQLVNKSFLIYIILRGKQFLSHDELQELENQFRQLCYKKIQSQNKKMQKDGKTYFHKNNISYYQNIQNLISNLVKNSIDKIFLKKVLLECFVQNVKIKECQGYNGVMYNQNLKVQRSLEILLSACFTQRNQNYTQNVNPVPSSIQQESYLNLDPEDYPPQGQQRIKYHQPQREQWESYLNLDPEDYSPQGQQEITSYIPQIKQQVQTEQFEFDYENLQTPDNILYFQLTAQYRHFHLNDENFYHLESSTDINAFY